MGEKRGGTEKIRFDFNDAAVLEVFMVDAWYRVIPNEFRSFDGDRRIREGDTVEDYYGSVYLFKSNIAVQQQKTNRIVRDLSQHQKL